MTISVGDIVYLEHKPKQLNGFSQAPWSGPLTVERMFENGEFWVLETVKLENGKWRTFGIWAQEAPEKCAGEGMPMHVVNANKGFPCTVKINRIQK